MRSPATLTRGAPSSPDQLRYILIVATVSRPQRPAPASRPVIQAGGSHVKCSEKDYLYAALHHSLAREQWGVNDRRSQINKRPDHFMVAARVTKK